MVPRFRAPRTREDTTNAVAHPFPVIVALAAFASGATLLQFCARLPPAPGVLLAVALAVVAALTAMAASGRRTTPAIAATDDASTPRLRVDVSAMLAAGLAAIAAAAHDRDCQPAR